ncbi:ferritin-like superfamily [Baffinella frigidus]|nr:ferritin-like superfamily [Cryptophyta sp. CCMP2293]
MRLTLVALLAAPMVAAFAPSVAPALRPATARMALSARAPSARPARFSFAVQQSKESTSIDFGEVGFAEADSQFSGMVFKPEVGSEPESRCRVDWHTECEKALNDHINVEYTASYAYHALYSYFDRDTVGLKGFANFFEAQSVEERGHATEFIQYQNIRGGQVVLKPLAVPNMQFQRSDGTSDALYAFELALMLEKFVYNKLRKLHDLGTKNNDPQFCDHVEKYLGEQVKAIKEMASYVAQIKRLGTGHGVWDLDKELGATVPAV